MEVLGHQHPAEKAKPELASDSLQDFDKYPAEPGAGEQNGPTVGTGSDKLQFAGNEVSRSRHAEGDYNPALGPVTQT